MFRWPYTFAVCLSLAVGATAVYYSQHLDVGLKDPEGFLGPAYVRLPLIGLLIFAVGIVPQSIHRFGFRHFIGGVRTIIRDEWTLKRVGYVAAGMLSFYICYVSYRNLKSYLPELREDVNYDRELAALDHFLFFGNYPAEVLHSVFGTAVMAQVLAVLYVLYLPFVPITVGAVLVLHRDFTVGAWYATAVSLNWVLGTISYYILPSLGPAFFQPQSFYDLPENGASALQMSLFKGAFNFKEDPQGDAIFGIAGFASLHVSVVFTACLFLHYAGINRLVRTAAWTYLGFTILATLYLGWHYIADDIGGLFIGWLAVAVGAFVTGNTRRQKRKRLAANEVEGVRPATEVATTGPSI
ncbi:phosphatase PAP2 family protein [Aeromicrobium sp. NPDC092404]|uniref:phosphatase PAP2 family protein n=1 Tax=Aeromicrobium sp. NPDC092404 TaxID=3154976 RepID=UPI003437C037